MSLLSKLFGGDKNAEKAAKELLNSLLGAQNAQKAARPQTNAAAASAAQPAQSAAPEPVRAAPAPRGVSWGDEMPPEENQYNSGLSYEQYFESVFAAEFPAYRVEKEVTGYLSRPVYTFRSAAGGKALVVELMSQKSEAKKLRQDCEREGVPYLRFYYDHHGWWNTRSYVTERIRAALRA